MWLEKRWLLTWQPEISLLQIHQHVSWEYDYGNFSFPCTSRCFPKSLQWACIASAISKMVFPLSQELLSWICSALDLLLSYLSTSVHLQLLSWISWTHAIHSWVWARLHGDYVQEPASLESLGDSGIERQQWVATAGSGPPRKATPKPSE